MLGVAFHSILSDRGFQQPEGGSASGVLLAALSLLCRYWQSGGHCYFLGFISEVHSSPSAVLQG